HEKYGETLLALGKKSEAIAHLIVAAQSNSRWGFQARQGLQKLGIQVPGQAGPPLMAPPSTRTIYIPSNSPLPPRPPPRNGRRRIIQPMPGGGQNVIIQQWNNSGGSHSASSSMQYVAPGQALPR